MLGKKHFSQPIAKICRWRNSRADYYGMYFDGTPIDDQHEFESLIRSGRAIPVFGDGFLDEGELNSVFGDGYVFPLEYLEILKQIPVNPAYHEQYLKDKAFEKMINERNSK